jgi:nucleoside-diphosphate-sugar epimerase
MHVLVTGASGHIGAPLVSELLEAGHTVAGLARSDASAAKVEALGAQAVRGDLADAAGIAALAADADGVVHLAFDHAAIYAGDWGGAIATDLAVIHAIGDALAGSGKPFVGTSGTLMLAVGGVTGRAGTEADVFPDGGTRIDNENAVAALAERDVRASVVRLPPTVHSELDLHGFVPTLIGIARERGVAAYVGDGANRWPAGHTLDAAHLYRLALESAPAGARLHAIGDEGVAFKDIAAVIGEQLGVPTASIAPDEAGDHFGFLGPLVQIDNPTDAARTRELLGWAPTHPGLLDDLRAGHYFAGGATG